MWYRSRYYEKHLYWCIMGYFLLLYHRSICKLEIDCDIVFCICYIDRCWFRSLQKSSYFCIPIIRHLKIIYRSMWYKIQYRGIDLVIMKNIYIVMGYGCHGIFFTFVSSQYLQVGSWLWYSILYLLYWSLLA